MAYPPAKILIVDDEPDILEILNYNLSKEGYTVFTARDGEEAIAIAKKELPGLIILDIMMPKMDGIELCRQIREDPQFNHALIVFLTARGEAYSEIAGFEVGADDYVTNPIKPKVFISRIKALLRRQTGIEADSHVIRLGDVVIDKEKYIVYKAGEELSLSRKEFEILSLLASKPGKLFTRQEIYGSIWGNKLIVGDRTLDVYVCKLRDKIGDEYIQTVKSVGYKFDF